MADFRACVSTDKALLVDVLAKGTERADTEDAPETSTTSEKVLPVTILTSALFVSVAQTDIVPIILAAMPEAFEGCLLSATTT